MMNKIQLEKYQRTIDLKSIGELGQEKFLKSKVFIVGVGGLGSQLLLHLAALGVGEIGIADVDNVSLNNLPRQVLYDESDVGLNKLDVASRKASSKNKDVKINKYNLLIDSSNALEVFKGYDLVIEASDNFKTKFIVEEACLKLGIPFVIAGVSGFQGQVILVTKDSKYTFKSLFDELPISVEDKYVKEDKPVYPLAVSLVSDIAANEAIKYLLNLGDVYLNTLITVDALKVEINKFKFE